LDENTNIKKNSVALLDTGKELGLEGNRETKYMFMSCHQTIGQNHYIKVANKSFENEAFTMKLSTD
jgi:23S rRNA maturation-related 3'-5' exoribonuclease YhaM